MLFGRGNCEKYSSRDNKSSRAYDGVRVAQYLVFCVGICGPLMVFHLFSLGHLIACLSAIYNFRLYPRYLHTSLILFIRECIDRIGDRILFYCKL